MQVVLDTNVVVSAVLSPAGPPGRLLDLVTDGQLQLIAEPRIIQEYRHVLLRPRFELPAAAVHRLIDNLEDLALVVTVGRWPHELPDPDDAVFLATAEAAQALLVSGNLRHFPAAKRGGVEVLTPRQLTERLDPSSGP